MLPLPVDPLPNPLRSSFAAMCTVSVAGPADTFTVVGLTLKLTSLGGELSETEITVIVEGKPNCCKSAGVKRAVLKTLSSRVRFIGYDPAGLNCGTVKVKSKIGLKTVPPVMGRLPRPNGLAPEL